MNNETPIEQSAPPVKLTECASPHHCTYGSRLPAGIGRYTAVRYLISTIALFTNSTLLILREGQKIRRFHFLNKFRDEITFSPSILSETIHISIVARLLYLLWLLLTSHLYQPVVDEISLGKASVLPSNPAKST